MSYSIQTLTNDITTVIHGTTANKIPNLYGIINRAARAVLLDVNPKETQRIVQLPGQVFSNVYDYALPSDVKGDNIIDLRLQAGRTPKDIFTQEYAQAFDANKSINFANKIYTQWNGGVKSIRIEASTLTSPTTLTDTSTLTGWSATAGAQNLSLDTTNNVAGGGAIQFDLAAGSSSGYLEISTLTAINMTSLVNIGSGFIWVYMPTGASVSSVNVRWGTDSSNYYNYTATTNQSGSAFVNGNNLIALPWASATKVGTPTSSQYKYVRVTVNYNSTPQTGMKICNLTFAPGYIFELQYYSKFLFRNNNTNAFQETVVDAATDSSTLINLDTESYNLLFNKTAFFVAQTLQGADSTYDATYWDSEYQNALKRYKAQNLSEAMLKGATYYKMPQKGYNRLYPRSNPNGAN